MKTNFLQCKTQKLNWLVSIIVLIFLVSCEKENLPQENLTLDATVQNKGKASTSNGFQAFHQGFNHDTDTWADQYVEGVLGWCGTINLMGGKSGDIMPSKGSGYATVMWGECNYFWSTPADMLEGKPYYYPAFEAGAPATQDPALWSASWPSAGFIQQLDIYLNPEMFEPGLAFMYSHSLFNSEEGSFIYFVVEVTKQEGELFINDFKIPEEGWYTFKYLFDSGSDGELEVDFALLNDGRKLYGTPILENMPAAPGEQPVSTSSFDVENYGSGYLWFVTLQDGVELPIDEQILRPGK